MTTPKDSTVAVRLRPEVRARFQLLKASRAAETAAWPSNQALVAEAIEFFLDAHRVALPPRRAEEAQQLALL